MAKGKRPGVMLYFDLAPVIHALTVEQGGILLRAILEYAEFGVLPDFQNDSQLLLFGYVSRGRLTGTPLPMKRSVRRIHIINISAGSRKKGFLFNRLTIGNETKCIRTNTAEFEIYQLQPNPITTQLQLQQQLGGTIRDNLRFAEMNAEVNSNNTGGDTDD